MAGVAVVLLAAFAGAACWLPAKGASRFDEMVAELRESTCPADATTTEPEIVRGRTESTARWRIESAMTMTELRNWITQNGSDGYVLTEHDDSTFTLRNTHATEVRLLHFTRSERPRVVAVHFSVAPW